VEQEITAAPIFAKQAVANGCNEALFRY